MSIAENKARYEASVVKALFDACPDHEICDRCYCCDAIGESDPCWQCGGFDTLEDDEFPDICSVCDGEGVVYYKQCVGNCDDEGNHAAVRTAIRERA